MNVVIYIIVIVVCIVLSGFFSSSETALLRISQHDVDDDIKEHVRPSVAAVKELIRNTSRLLVTILLGNNIVNILATSTSAALFVHYFGAEKGVLYATVVMTVLILLLSEIIPKAIAAKHPKRLSYFVSMPLYILHKTLTPFHWLFETLIDPLISKLLGTPSQKNVRTYDSILMLARQVHDDASIPNTNQDGTALPIIGSTARAAEMTAEEIMVPRAEIFAVDAHITSQELMDRMMNERYTRVPVYVEDLDKITGLIHLKDLIRITSKHEEDITRIIKPILQIPERRPILSILAEMQRSFVHVAIVKDEFGITQGLLTQEDILEEIVGEIRDEFDKDELQSIQQISEHTYMVLGRIPVHDFNRQTGWNIETEKGDTFSGLVFNSLGHQPRLGDKVSLGEYELSVSDLSGSRITHVHVVKLAPPEN
ncbi:MAG: HlyC/CorC family transporter [Deltaproteobacteria bacterium]|nr:HlyC/CorC family transporter [Deltaproteobacteria bacterium]